MKHVISTSDVFMLLLSCLKRKKKERKKEKRKRKEKKERNTCIFDDVIALKNIIVSTIHQNLSKHVSSPSESCDAVSLF